jgi:hypothetical protein
MTYFLTSELTIAVARDRVVAGDVTYRMGTVTYRYLPNARAINLTNTWSKPHTKPMTTDTKTMTTEV